MANKPKRKPAPPIQRPPRTIAIGDYDCIGPDALEIPDALRNEKEIAAWWERAKLYATAMEPLGRAVLLRFSSDEQSWYVASVPNDLKIPTGAGHAE